MFCRVELASELAIARPNDEDPLVPWKVAAPKSTMRVFPTVAREYASEKYPSCPALDPET
jgi:hypothetical protein